MTETTTIDARTAAASLNLDLLELAQILRRFAADKLEVAARVVVHQDGEYAGWDGVENLLAAAKACEVAHDEDNPITEEG